MIIKENTFKYSFKLIGEFAIKLLYHDEEKAQRKMATLDLLTSYGFRAPKPIKTIKNEYYAIYKTNIPYSYIIYSRKTNSLQGNRRTSQTHGVFWKTNRIISPNLNFQLKS
ncbi:MAG: hypothetical protein HGN29_06190 [Asgard group archaeon]|nr:hypothetical protein [Asgard group archaeon]